MKDKNIFFFYCNIDIGNVFIKNANLPIYHFGNKY